MKKSTKIKVVFFGSGPVAAESLKLLKDSFDVEAVLTKPTTLHELEEVSGNSRVFTVANKSELDTLLKQERFTSDLGILIDFGILVSKEVIDYFAKGIVNSHFSLLPELRGPDPISFAILEGKKKTGVSLMLLVEAMDEGPILSVGVLKLDGSETTPSLTQELIKLSYELLRDAVPRYIDGALDLADQEVIKEKFKLEESYTRKLQKSDGILDWSKSAEELEREIRAYIDWPKSRGFLGTIDCIVLKASVIEVIGKPGRIFIQDSKIGIYCGKDALLLETLKPAGKKEMTSSAFLAGYKDKIFITST